MKKNNKGFFLIEAIVIISLVTIVMAYVYPNLAKIYDNFERRVKYYDQTEDIYVLKVCQKMATAGTLDLDNLPNIGGLEAAKIVPYNAEAGEIINKFDSYENDYENDYNFRKYIKRLKQLNIDNDAYRLIGIFEHNFEHNSITTYASIKISSSDINISIDSDNASSLTSQFKYLDIEHNAYIDAYPNDDDWFNLNSLGNNPDNQLYIAIKDLDISKVDDVTINEVDNENEIETGCDLIGNEYYCDVNEEGIHKYNINVYYQNEDGTSYVGPAYEIEVKKDTVPPELNINVIYKLFNIAGTNVIGNINSTGYLNIYNDSLRTESAYLKWYNIINSKSEIDKINKIFIDNNTLNAEFTNVRLIFDAEEKEFIEYPLTLNNNNVWEIEGISNPSKDIYGILFGVGCKNSGRCEDTIAAYNSGGFQIRSEDETVKCNKGNMRRFQIMKCTDEVSLCNSSISYTNPSNNIDNKTINDVITIEEDDKKAVGIHKFTVADKAGNIATKEIDVPSNTCN